MILPISPRARSRADTLFWGHGPESWVCRYLLMSRTILCILSITNPTYSFIKNQDSSLDSLCSLWQLQYRRGSFSDTIVTWLTWVWLTLLCARTQLAAVSGTKNSHTRVLCKREKDLSQKLGKCFTHKASIIRKSDNALHFVLELSQFRMQNCWW